MALVKPARCTDRHGQHCCTVAAGYAPEFLRWHSVARPNEPVETIATSRRVDVSVRENRHSLRRVVTRRIEVREIVCLCVDRLTELVTHAELETQLAIHFPTVGSERFSLRETEKAHRIEGLFTVCSEISKQCVRERVITGPCITAGVEINLARVSRACILIDAVASDAQASLQRVVATHPRD